MQVELAEVKKKHLLRGEQGEATEGELRKDASGSQSE